METTLQTEITVAEMYYGSVYNTFEGKGLFGLNKKLTIQHMYQRNFIYSDEVKNLVANGFVKNRKEILNTCWAAQSIRIYWTFEYSVLP